MSLPQTVQRILDAYGSEAPGTRANLARMLLHGRLAGTGRMVILPVDQGFEHGPARSFAANPAAYDPLYHVELAIDAGLSAYAAPLGMIEVAADTHPGAIPLILKVNSANSLHPDTDNPTQAITAGVDDALRLGCTAIGYTLYPGSAHAYAQINDLRALTAQAKAVGLAVVVWCYPRGGFLSAAGETAVDICAYAAHMACLAGAHVVKVKLPTDALELPAARSVYETERIPVATLAERVAHVVQACFAGRRLVVFSGGGKKGAEGVLDDARAIRDGGGNGSIIGRNSFQRPRGEALDLLSRLVEVYLGRG